MRRTQPLRRIAKTHLFDWWIIQGVWSDVGKANQETSCAVNVWIFLHSAHRIQQITFII